MQDLRPRRITGNAYVVSLFGAGTNSQADQPLIDSSADDLGIDDQRLTRSRRRAGQVFRMNVVEQRWADYPSTELVQKGRNVMIVTLGGRPE